MVWLVSGLLCQVFLLRVFLIFHNVGNNNNNGNGNNNKKQQAYYAAKGIKLLKGLLAKELKAEGGASEQPGKVASVVLSDGSSLPADLVVVGAGARPASGLFK